MVSETKTVEFTRSPLIDPLRKIIGVVSRILWRLEYTGTENIPESDGRGLIIAANHQTYFDPFWISVPVERDIRYLAWDKALEWPLIGSFIASLGAVPVSLSGKSALSTLRSTLRLLKQGYAVMIFPEGSRQFSDGEMLEFKTGTAHLAQLSKARILPVKLEGANRVWPQDWKVPRFRKVRISFGKVIEPNEVTKVYKKNKSLDEVSDLIRNRIEEINSDKN